MDNIRKLREKVENDPKSTLFVPLAEEYKKAGQLDEAIDVLKAGIERQPAYMSARVSLGKIYLEKDMLQEAKEEFETVIKAIPDNLVAHRKLAEIGRLAGDREGAIRHYRKLVSLNSMDEYSQQVLQLLLAGGGMEEQPQEEAVEEAGVEAVHVEEEFEPIGAPVEELEELNARNRVDETTPGSGDMVLSLADKDALEEVEGGSGKSYVKAVELDGGAGDSIEGQSIPVAEEVEEGETAFPEVLDVNSDETADGQDEEECGEFQLPDDEGVSLEELAAEVSRGAGGGDLGQSGVDSIIGGTVQKRSPQETPTIGRNKMPKDSPASLSREEMSGDSFSEQGGESKAKGLGGTGGQAADSALLSDADTFISAGDYAKALEIYRRMLSTNPRNGQVLQRVEELKTLLRLLGKENEELVFKLESFLDAVKRRRDEFYGNS